MRYICKYICKYIYRIYVENIYKIYIRIEVFKEEKEFIS